MLEKRELFLEICKGAADMRLYWADDNNGVPDENPTGGGSDPS